MFAILGNRRQKHHLVRKVSFIRRNIPVQGKCHIGMADNYRQALGVSPSFYHPGCKAVP